MPLTIKNPIEWSGAQVVHMAQAIGSLGRSLHHMQDTIRSPAQGVRRIGMVDLGAALREGLSDFAAYRTDVIFLCVIYAVVGMVLARVAFGMDMLPLLFPLASGFAIVGPAAAILLYEMSRRREQGQPASLGNAFDVLRAPAAGSVLVLGLILVGLFLLWQAAAWQIYLATMGSERPTSFAGFAHDVLYTDGGRALVIIGCGVGFLFAALAMAISLVSFPLLIDRDVGIDTAIRTSLRAVRENPGPVAVWGLIVAAGLVLGSLPLFVGLVITIPVLGHATWHLYRRIVV
jgi:uncharacterized membrane protein